MSSARRECPLVSFVLLAYKQEQYVREAVEGALAQTHSPLEIILSDDCSSDSTFAIIEEMAAKYTGPATIVLNRNPKNLGLGGHVNRVMEFAHGELIVVAAGDDVSEPERCSKIVSKWAEAGFPSGSIFSNTYEFGDGISCVGSPAADASSCLIEVLRGSPHKIIGSSHAWTRDLFERLGSLRCDIVNEDSAIFFRSCLLGQVMHIEEPLVRHRRHDSNTGAGGRGSVRRPSDLIDFHLRTFQRMSSLLKNLRDDLTKCGKAKITTKYGNGDLSRIFRDVGTQIHFLDVVTAALKRPVRRKALTLVYLAAHRNAVSKYIRRTMPQLLLPSMYLTLVSVARRATGSRRAAVRQA